MVYIADGEPVVALLVSSQLNEVKLKNHLNRLSEPTATEVEVKELLELILALRSIDLPENVKIQTARSKTAAMQ